MQELKNSLSMTLALLPENALIGIITFGRFTEIHRLTQFKWQGSYVINSTDVVSAKQLEVVYTYI